MNIKDIFVGYNQVSVSELEERAQKGKWVQTGDGGLIDAQSLQDAIQTYTPLPHSQSKRIENAGVPAGFPVRTAPVIVEFRTNFKHENQINAKIL